MTSKSNYHRMIARGSLVALAGYILSGPVAFIAVNMIAPQPPWESAELFVSHYSTLQDMPYYFGFFLIGGMLMTAAGHYLACREENQEIKFYLLMALGLTMVFCTLISFNYICQTTFVHNLALHYQPGFSFAVSTFSMANPLSFCWANEMWGYAFLGIATWLTAGYYKGKNNFIRILLISNGILSLISAVWTIVNVSWVMTTLGLISYFLWNILMIVLMIAIFRTARQQTAAPIMPEGNH